jgi:hypothetical protein
MRMMVQTALEDQIVSILKVDKLRAGRHIVRDERGWKAGEFWVDGIWAARIKPSFHSPAMLAVVTEKQCVRGAFAVSTGSPHHIETVSTIEAEFAPDWADPVAEILRQFNLFRLGGTLSLDGIGYELQVDTLAGKAVISFCNPTVRPLVDLEHAFLQVAYEIVALKGKQLEKDYLIIWQECLTGRLSDTSDQGAR